MKTVLITGASGFIGSALCKALIKQYRVIAIDNRSVFLSCNHYIPVQSDILDDAMITNTCDTYRPDIVIHCAGIAHQKILNRKNKRVFDLVNHIATGKLAKAAALSNPDLHFIFLSSVSVYGENQNKKIISETDACFPKSPYAQSKLDAENRLIEMYQASIIRKMDILRLAPVYDQKGRSNLEKRVLSPKKICYLRYGTGNQRMSALAKKNLVEFMEFILNEMTTGQFCRVMNICDNNPYTFNDIIDVFQKTTDYPQKPLVTIPLFLVRWPVNTLARFPGNNPEWIYSFYNKLAKDQVFDNKRMSGTGFKPRWGLESVFINSDD